MLKHGYSVAETASILGVTRQTIYNWMKQKSLALAA
ncbi:MAG: helix-turn-helix domain-containing protein [Gammaproteobacteria bacterium]|nr:helix-turn-helix domain-containing protein [Gammaproteobacteria bacterium]